MRPDPRPGTMRPIMDRTGRTSLQGSVPSAPGWLRDLGIASWLLVGFVLIIFGLIWLLGQTSTIVMPVILAGVLGAVTGPIVDALERRRVPRAAGAALVLLGLIAIAVLVFVLIIGGITSQSSDISAMASQAADKLESWLKSLGIDNTASAKNDVKNAVPDIGSTLLKGVADGVQGLTSLVFFLSFSALSTFFVLKDSRVMGAFINRHLGVPVPLARTITSNIASALRGYFAGVTIVAAFNAVVVGAVALVLGVPLAGTIAVVTFVTAYVPYIGAWAAGGFAVALALGSQGPTDALILGISVLLANGLLQNILQPFVFGATLSLNPLAVLVVTIGAGCLFGMVGLTLAAPLTSAAVHISNARRSDGEAPPEDPVIAGARAPQPTAAATSTAGAGASTDPSPATSSPAGPSV
jgi:putative heme transporter